MFAHHTYDGHNRRAGSGYALRRLAKIKVFLSKRVLTVVTYYRSHKNEPMPGKAFLLRFSTFSMETIVLRHMKSIAA